MPIGNKLKEIRMREFMEEPKEFADRIGIPIRTYYQYEEGTSRPKLEIALTIAKILNRTVNDIWYLE